MSNASERDLAQYLSSPVKLELDEAYLRLGDLNRREERLIARGASTTHIDSEIARQMAEIETLRQKLRTRSRRSR